MVGSFEGSVAIVGVEVVEAFGASGRGYEYGRQLLPVSSKLLSCPPLDEAVSRLSLVQLWNPKHIRCRPHRPGHFDRTELREGQCLDAWLSTVREC